MTKIIVVVGITGTQGGSVARTFLQTPGWHVRGITRNPSSDAAKAIIAEGAEVVQGDLDDKASLLRAFQSANVIFSNTDFFSHLFHGMSNPDVIPVGQTLLSWSKDREVEQGMNIAEAAEDPSVLATLERFIFSSLSDASKWSGGKYKTVYHFDSKGEMLRQTEQRCPGVMARLSTVQIGHYMELWKMVPKMAPQKQPDGSFLLSRSSPPGYKMPLLVASKDVGPFVKAAATELPIGKNIIATSDYMTFPEYAALWGKVNGVKTGYKEISSEEFFEGMPPALAEEIQVSFDYMRDFGFAGGDPDILWPDQLGIKVPVTSIEDWVRSEDWSSIL